MGSHYMEGAYNDGGFGFFFFAFVAYFLYKGYKSEGFTGVLKAIVAIIGIYVLFFAGVTLLTTAIFSFSKLVMLAIAGIILYAIFFGKK